MKQPNLNEIFYASIKFGKRQINKAIIAKNSKDAIDTVNDYYDEPIIVAIMSLQELLDFIIECEEKQGLCLIYELVMGLEGLDVVTHKEQNKTVEELEREFEDKNTFIVSAEGVAVLINSIMISLEGSSESPLISEYFTL